MVVFASANIPDPRQNILFSIMNLILLASTDALIDQVVYKLYGLTDDKIKIVERKS